MKKMTNREFYNAVIEANVNEELTAFATAALEKMDTRLATRKNTPTKAQTENAALAQELASMMEAGTTYTAAMVAEMLGVNQSKATSVLKVLGTSMEIEVTEVKQTGKRPVKGYTIVSN